MMSPETINEIQTAIFLNAMEKVMFFDKQTINRVFLSFEIGLEAFQPSNDDLDAIREAFLQKYGCIVENITFNGGDLAVNIQFRTWNDWQELADVSMSLPYDKYDLMKEDHILDENKTVVWNREEVKRLNSLRKSANDKNRFLRNLLHSMIKDLQIERARELFELDKYSDKALGVIYGCAYSEGHSAGYSEVFCYFQEYLEMVLEFIKVAND